MRGKVRQAQETTFTCTPV